MALLTRADLIQRQSLPLEAKIRMSQNKIRQWADKWGTSGIFVSFSGGKDSTVLLHLVRSVIGCQNVPAVFTDTGLEYPEIRDFVKSVENVTWLRPELTFKQVIQKYGYPAISKAQARFVNDVQNAHEGNKKTVALRLTGITSTGRKAPSRKLSEKWKKFVGSGISLSDKCCHYLKTNPLDKYAKITGRKVMTGVMAGESRRRAKDYMEYGCNAYESNRPTSKPIAFWKEEDIWEYIRRFNVPYSKIYDMGEKRTGCMFCMFGVHLENGENRFQRMKKSHPKQWDYCINKLRCGDVLKFMGVDYE